MGVIEDTGMSDRDKMEMMIEVSGIHKKSRAIVENVLSGTKAGFKSTLIFLIRFAPWRGNRSQNPQFREVPMFCIMKKCFAPVVGL